MSKALSLHRHRGRTISAGLLPDSSPPRGLRGRGGFHGARLSSYAPRLIALLVIGKRYRETRRSSPLNLSTFTSSS